MGGMVKRRSPWVWLSLVAGGLELIDNLRAGCTGLILAPDTIDGS